MPTLAGKPVGSTGFGLMGLTWRDEQTPDEQAFAAMKAALEGGANFWNGGEFYGPPDANSLQLLNRYFTKYPEDAERVVISIKGCFTPQGPDASVEGVRRSVDNTLRLLGGTKKLDLFESGRVDGKVPIEVTMRTLAEYVEAGKLGGISLSECSADSIRRAAKVHKIDAVEVEFSLFAREILDNGVAKACADLDIPVVAYSPLGRGFLTGQIRSRADLPKGDHRLHFPQFTEENLPKNLKLADEVAKIAKRKGCTVGNVSIAWVKAQSGRNGNPNFIPIPGATTASRVAENTTDITLDEADLKELDDVLATIPIIGERYPEAVMKLNFGDSPRE